MSLRGLERVLDERMGWQDSRVVAERPFTEGWSMETSAVTVRYRDGDGEHERELVVRREPARGLVEPYDVAKEARVLQEAARGGIPVPHVYFVEADPSVFERPFCVMEHVDGFVPEIGLGDAIDCFAGKEELRAGLADDFVAILSRIHNIDATTADFSFLRYPRQARSAALLQVEHWEEVLARAGQPDPLVSLAIAWLKANAPHTDRPALLHSDFRTGNYIVRDGRIAAVLDWEMAHIGDIHEDLCFTLNELWKSPGPQRRVCHVVDEQVFIDRYQAETGRTIDRQRLVYFNVLLQLKSVGIAASAISAFESGKIRNIRMALFGYHYDVFRALLAHCLRVAMEVCR